MQENSKYGIGITVAFLMLKVLLQLANTSRHDLFIETTSDCLGMQELKTWITIPVGDMRNGLLIRGVITICPSNTLKVLNVRPWAIGFIYRHYYVLLWFWRKGKLVW